MNRVLFVLGLGVGFVLGARAGRGRYEQLKRTAQRVADNEQVQDGVAAAQQALDEATPVVAERARQFVDRAGETSKRVAARLGEGAHQVGERATEATTSLVDRVSSRADDLSARVTHTAEDLRARSEELRRRGEEQIDLAGRRVSEQVERSRDAQAESFIMVGDLREQALAEIVTDDDDMLEPGERAAARHAAAGDDAPHDGTTGDAERA